tara:strand:+ start:352 stop:1338 length:987 start_codon:yes stop_codon:yes gene_type:complete
MSEMFNPDDKAAFISLRKHPSFTKLSNDEREDLVSLIDKTKNNAKNGSWLIDNNELNIVYPEFASGSFSNVYNCFWRGSSIAIKKPKNNNISNLKELLKEIEVWNTIRHPNLVQFMGVSFNSEEENISILMEKINGLNLEQFLNNKTMSINNLKKNIIISQIISAINFLHNCSPPVIYRDLKPANIMVSKEMSVKLTDFGLSKYFITNENESYIMTGSTGTIRYMAPEVYLNKQYGLNVDIYSLGLIIYYVFTNNKPFLEYNLDKMHNYFNSDDLIFSTKNLKNKDLRTIVNWCIEKDSSKRWNINKLDTEWNKMINDNNNNKKCVLS